MKESISHIYQQFRESAECLYLKGWAEAFAGNMSVRIDAPVNSELTGRAELPKGFNALKGAAFLVTASGSRMRQVKDDPGKYICIVKISGDGKYLSFSSTGGNRPTSEIYAHLMIHETLLDSRPEKTSVLHCHPDNIIVLSGSGSCKNDRTLSRALTSSHTEIETLIPDGAGIIKRMAPGSHGLAKALGEKFRKKDIVFLEGHGSFSCGRDLNDALDIAEAADKAASIYLELTKLNMRK